MRNTRAPDRGKQNCSHPRTITTTNVGLEREVCQACGHVSFQYAHETSSDEAVKLIEEQNSNLTRLKRRGRHLREPDRIPEDVDSDFDPIPLYLRELG